MITDASSRCRVTTVAVDDDIRRCHFVVARGPSRGKRWHHVVQEERFDEDVDDKGGDQAARQDVGRPVVAETGSRRRGHVYQVLEADRGQVKDRRGRGEQEAHNGHGGRCDGRLHARRVVGQNQSVLL